MKDVSINSDDQFIHDIRNPINAISMSAELGTMLTKDNDLDRQKLLSLFTEIKHQCDECNTILIKKGNQ